MTLKDTYFATSGLAHVRGVDSFGEVIPFSRFKSLWLACIETKGFKWVERNFSSWIVSIAGRESRSGGVEVPNCERDCKYRMKYSSLPIQRNALRVEIIEPTDRCGWNLKDGRLGGNPDDYHPCCFCG